jgi:hypothetical protein
MADEAKTRLEEFIDRVEAYQSAVDLLLTAIVQEGIKPDYTPAFKALVESCTQLKRQPTNSPVTDSTPTAAGFYWCVHKATGKVTSEVVDNLRSPTRSFKDYFWIGPVAANQSAITT